MFNNWNIMTNKELKEWEKEAKEADRDIKRILLFAIIVLAIVLIGKII